MTSLNHEVEQVSGGTAQYDAGHAMGVAARRCFDAFVEAGSLYTPTL